MTRVHRILRKKFSKNPFDGEGAFLFGGRWSSPGTRVAYAAEHLSLAMIEYFMHLDTDDPLQDLVSVAAEVPEDIPKVTITVKQLPINWRKSPALPALTAIGDSFARDGKSAILVVPSALVPAESNWLLNSRHADFSKIRVLPAERLNYDPRFFV